MMNKQNQITDTFEMHWNELKSQRFFGLMSDSEFVAILREESAWYKPYASAISSALNDVKPRTGTSELNVLDAGCGLGLGICSIILTCPDVFSRFRKINYWGVDLIDLSLTERMLRRAFNLILPESTANISLSRADFTSLSHDHESLDLVLALGSLHHTPSVGRSLTALVSMASTHCVFIGWIINKQKPLRAITDDYFRVYFGDLSGHDTILKLRDLAELFAKIGRVIGDSTVDVEREIEALDLKPGQYRVQEILYDYVWKCFYQKPGDDQEIETATAQLQDWFMPKYYHQTSRGDLHNILVSDLGLKNFTITETTNGLLFGFNGASR